MSELYLAHHGILGQKWGVRRYQNEDGTLTEAGKKHYTGANYTNAIRKLNNDFSGQKQANKKQYKSEVKAIRKDKSISRKSKKEAMVRAEQRMIDNNTKAFKDTISKQNDVLRNTSNSDIKKRAVKDAVSGILMGAGGTTLRMISQSTNNIGLNFVGSFMEGYGYGQAVMAPIVGYNNYKFKNKY